MNNTSSNVIGLDHLEFYVADPSRAARFYAERFGLAQVPRIGDREGTQEQYLMCACDVRFLLTGPATFSDRVAEQVRRHGDAVRNIALAVADADAVFHDAVCWGAAVVMEPRTSRHALGDVRVASVALSGDLMYSFVERTSTEWFLPRFGDSKPLTDNAACLVKVDHVALCVQRGTVDEWVEFHEQVLGFHQTHHEYVETASTAMDARFVESADGEVRFPLLQSADDREGSQIEEFLRQHGGPGVQHAALLTNDIIATVRALRANGVAFLDCPATYYDALTSRVGTIDEPLSALRAFHLLVDRDAWGYLLQIFSKSLHERPTFFLEIIQRKGARSFGSANIKALYDAVERDQMLHRIGAEPNPATES